MSKETCHSCFGSGIFGTDGESCPTCGGEGIFDCGGTATPQPAPLPVAVEKACAGLRRALVEPFERGPLTILSVESKHTRTILRALSALQVQLAAKERECEELREEAVCLGYESADFLCAIWPRLDTYEADRADLNATCAALAVAAKRDRERAESAEFSRDGYKARCEAAECHMRKMGEVFDEGIATLQREMPHASTYQEASDAKSMLAAFEALKCVNAAALAATEVK